MAWICLEYLCPDGHRTASLEDRDNASPFLPCACGLDAERTMSAPRLKFSRGVVATGRNYDGERPPGIPDTRELADGMSYGEWRKKNSDKYREAVGDDLKRAARRELDRSDRIK